MNRNAAWFGSGCILAWVGAGTVAADAAAPAATTQPGITLEKIMADPDWIGPAVKDEYWSANGRSVYYSLKRRGSPIVDLHRIDIAGGSDRVVDPKAMAERGRAGGIRCAPASGLLLPEMATSSCATLPSGRLRQITRTPQIETAPQFSADGRLLSFRVDNDWFVHDFASGVTAPAAVVKAEKDPDAPPTADDLRDMQLRTFSTLKRLHDESEAGKKHLEELRKGDATRAAAPFYLGEDVIIRDTELSPDARWLLVVTVPKSAAKGFEGKLTRYVTESGYEEFETGARARRPQPARRRSPWCC